MLKLLVSVVSLILVVAVAATAALGEAPSGNKIQCFSGTEDGGYNGTCDLLSPNRAFLDTTDGDTNPNNAYAGVYLPNQEINGTLIGDVSKLAFSYSGTGASGGSPRLSIPIDTNGNGSTDVWAYVDVLGCNDGSTTAGRLDAINDPTCTISLSDGSSYANWAAFVAAHPTYKIATDNYTFVVQDQPGEFTIWNVQLGNKSRGGK